ncbi:MAG: DUF4169 family protein [Rhodospirillales bacterium]|nr:DUF4169 family protein [Rhodospirillales bacterium]
MAEIVNLRGKRKAQARVTAAAKAAENRARFGRAKPARKLDAAEAARAAAELAGKKIDR